MQDDIHSTFSEVHHPKALCTNVTRIWHPATKGHKEKWLKARSNLIVKKHHKGREKRGSGQKFHNLGPG